MITPLRPLVCAALLAGAPGAQVVIDEVAPASGTIGTAVTITGSGFGAGKPKVFLQAPGGGKACKLKVTAFGDGQIEAEVRKAVAGDLLLHVRPKGKDAGEATAPFTVELPAITSLDPAGGPPGLEVTLTGTAFGNRPVKVLVNGKKAKVTGWTDTSATFRIPSSVPDGEWMVEVANKIGAGASDAGLVIVGSNKTLGPDAFKAKVRKQALSGGGNEIEAADNGTNVAFDVMRDGNPTRQLSVLVPFFMGSHEVPKVFSGNGYGSQPIFYREVYDVGGGQQFTTTWSARPDELPWHVTITGRSGDRLVGRLAGVLEIDSGPGETLVEVVDGEFVLSP